MKSSATKAMWAKRNQLWKQKESTRPSLGASKSAPEYKKWIKINNQLYDLDVKMGRNPTFRKL